MPNFTIGAQQTQRDLAACFQRWGISHYEISLAKNSQNGEAWVKFLHPSMGQRALSCDSFPQYFENLRAIFITLDDIRKAEGRGILEQYRQFFEALPEPGQTSDARKPWQVLGIQEDAPNEVAEAAYRALSKSAHPDVGGSTQKMAALNEAIEHFRQRPR